MNSHRLKMNPDKTQLLWRGTLPQLSKVAVNEVALSTGLLGFLNSRVEPQRTF